MRKVILLLSFFSFAPTVLVFTAVFLVFVTFQQTTRGKGLSFFFGNHQSIAYAALPDNTNNVSAVIGVGDVRVGKVASFLQDYGSPLAPYAEAIVMTSDKYGIDFRLIPAIAMQESGGCQKVIGDSNNCWGYGIYGKYVYKFDNFQDGIETMGKYLADNKKKGLDTIDKLGMIYNPSNHNDWKGKVSLFLSEMQ